MTDFHEGDMAEELAEREYLSVTALELFEVAKRHILGKWLDAAIVDPAYVREQYDNMMMGEDVR